MWEMGIILIDNEDTIEIYYGTYYFINKRYSKLGRYCHRCVGKPYIAIQKSCTTTKKDSIDKEV